MSHLSVSWLAYTASSSLRPIAHRHEPDLQPIADCCDKRTSTLSLGQPSIVVMACFCCSDRNASWLHRHRPQPCTVVVIDNRGNPDRELSGLARAIKDALVQSDDQTELPALGQDASLAPRFGTKIDSAIPSCSAATGVSARLSRQYLGPASCSPDLNAGMLLRLANAGIFAHKLLVSAERREYQCPIPPGSVANGTRSAQPVATSTIITVWMNEPATFGAAVGALSAELSRGPPSQPRPRDSNQRPSDESRERFAFQPADEELDHRRMVEDGKASCPLNRGGVRRQNTALKQQHPDVRPVLD